MLSTLLRLALALALVGPAWSQKCEGQSCTIAALSGSSDRTFNPKTPPEGGTNKGDCCIIKHNPVVAPVLFKLRPELKKFCAQESNPHILGSAVNEEQLAAVAATTNCTPFTLIFSKGTSEPGPIGITVGPALKRGLDRSSPGMWSVMGVEYLNNDQGDFCLGLPGGIMATKLLETTAKACPKTKIIMGGYSQGALLVHNGIAHATKSAVARVTGAVVFGDPFDGAKIKGYHGPIKTYCATKDQVCDGLFKVSAAHLSYVGMNTTEAVAYMEKLVGAKKHFVA